jgi:hypothetical protein
MVEQKFLLWHYVNESLKQRRDYNLRRRILRINEEVTRHLKIMETQKANTENKKKKSIAPPWLPGGGGG